MCVHVGPPSKDEMPPMNHSFIEAVGCIASMTVCERDEREADGTWHASQRQPFCKAWREKPSGVDQRKRGKKGSQPRFAWFKSHNTDAQIGTPLACERKRQLNRRL